MWLCQSVSCGVRQVVLLSQSSRKLQEPAIYSYFIKCSTFQWFLPHLRGAVSWAGGRRGGIPWRCSSGHHCTVTVTTPCHSLTDARYARLVLTLFVSTQDGDPGWSSPRMHSRLPPPPPPVSPFIHQDRGHNTLYTSPYFAPNTLFIIPN